MGLIGKTGFVLTFAVALSACALNNGIVIKSNESWQPNYYQNGFDFRFPDKKNISIEKLSGASWEMNGDLSDTIGGVVTDIFAFGFDGLSSQQNSYMQVQGIKIRYQDYLVYGASSILSISLELDFVGNYNGVYIEDCQLERILSGRSAPIHHGLFATRDKMRVMIQPVYEELIQEALHQALISGLNCLSNKSESKLMN